MPRNRHDPQMPMDYVVTLHERTSDGGDPYLYGFDIRGGKKFIAFRDKMEPRAWRLHTQSLRAPAATLPLTRGANYPSPGGLPFASGLPEGLRQRRSR